MPLSLKDPETERLARQVAALTGDTLTGAIRSSLAERLERERRWRGRKRRLAEELMELGRHCAALPDYDTRSPDEIMGFDEYGAFRPW
ncbi:MAG TPA: type II toxin-antitoxin system VapB family antitoxin [Caulobacteraceae bacterium]|nr:type II toxin-antitoxin system VapB family antitoxin [Caulobacteraceae bacterium]